MADINDVTEVKRYSPVTDFCRSFICEKVKLVVGACVVNLLVVVVFVGVAKGYCVLQIPAIANFILLFLALTLLAYCEALHYAVVSIEKWDMSEVSDQLESHLLYSSIVLLTIYSIFNKLNPLPSPITFH